MKKKMRKTMTMIKMKTVMKKKTMTMKMSKETHKMKRKTSIFSDVYIQLKRISRIK